MKIVLGTLLYMVSCDGVSVDKIISDLDRVENDIDTKLFLYETPSFQWIQSTVYRYADFKESLYVMATEGVANKKFYIGEDVANGHVYGLVNIAAFLAQSMKETIKYDACDENSWDLVNGKYPLSNACGQLGQSYQDYHCSEEERHMECEVDPNMSITATTHAKWYGAPAPLFCGPKTQYPHSGFWDYGYECNKGWASPPETCDVYEGQKAGKFDHSEPYANTAGRTDVEACCWWGRGVIQTSGVCNFGKLNYYLGARAAEEGRESKYPSVDFCKDPEVICSSSQYKELKWVAGMFYWMESVQPYNEGGWSYLDELAKFVEGDMQGTSFIDAVSGIVNRGCHNPPCGTGAVDGGHERSQNFKKVLDTFFQGSPPELLDLTTSINSGSPANASSLSNITPSSPSAPSQSREDKWYPDYNGNWAEGKCSNAYPAPSGRPHYDSHSECCAMAYAGQASGVCVGMIHSYPVESHLIPSSPTTDSTSVSSVTSRPSSNPSLAVERSLSPAPDSSTISSVTTQPTNKPVASFSAEEISQPTNKPLPSFFVEETEEYKWYPDYNPIWALGKCSNFSPVPSGRPHYDSQSECCKMAYNGQASGACVGYTTSTVSKLETFYPDYNGDWSLGKCSNAYPAPGGRPQYNSQQECCDKAYAGQSSGACINDLPLTTENGLDQFYPNYDPIFSKGICTNKFPLPHGRPIYASQSECCEFAYRGQASGACVNHKPSDTYELVSFAETFTSEFMAPHAALRSNFVVYSCGESNSIPYDTAIMDILFDYEVLLPRTVQAQHALPTVKKEIMDSLASSLNCQMITRRRRGLRQVVDGGLLLGFQSLDGSDVIDGDKGSCTEKEGDGDRCFPVIGHIAALLKFQSSNDEVLDVKKDILKNIRHVMNGNSISHTSGIKFVNEHDIENIQQAQVSNPEADATADSGSRPWVAVVCCLIGIAVGVALTLSVTNRRLAEIIKSRTHNTDESNNSIRDEEISVEENSHTKFSLTDESSCDERRSGCSSLTGLDCDDQPSKDTGDGIHETSNRYQKMMCQDHMTDVSKKSNDPSITVENAMMADDVEQAQGAEEGDKTDVKHEEKESNMHEGVEKSEEIQETRVSSERGKQDDRNFVLD